MRDTVTTTNVVDDSCESTIVLKSKAVILSISFGISIYQWHSGFCWRMLNIWLLFIITRWIMVWNKTVFCLEVVIYKCLRVWRHNYVISRNEYF